MWRSPIPLCLLVRFRLCFVRLTARSLLNDGETPLPESSSSSSSCNRLRIPQPRAHSLSPLSLLPINPHAHVLPPHLHLCTRTLPAIKTAPALGSSVEKRHMSVQDKLMQKLAQGQALAESSLRLTDAEFAVCRLHDAFIAAQVKRAVTAPVHVSAGSVALPPSASAACCRTSVAQYSRSPCSARCRPVLLPCLKPRTDVRRLLLSLLSLQLPFILPC